jgi:hypothetical protein
VGAETTDLRGLRKGAAIHYPPSWAKGHSILPAQGAFCKGGGVSAPGLAKMRLAAGKSLYGCTPSVRRLYWQRGVPH